MKYRIQGQIPNCKPFYATEVNARQDIHFETADINDAFQQLIKRIEVAPKENTYEVVEFYD